jgi:putative transposase
MTARPSPQNNGIDGTHRAAPDDRDLNAATNILAEGLSVSACGAGVSLQRFSVQQSALKQEAQPAMAGIPRL